MKDTPPVVLARRASTGVPADLWVQLDDLGWLPPPVSHIVIQVGQKQRSAVVEETALALARFLAGRSDGTAIDVVDAGAGDGSRGPWRVRDLGAEPTHSLAAIAMPGAVSVPALWLEPVFLVTVTGVGPSSAGRIDGVLAAQAEPLGAAGNRAALVCEAHRLSASDLAIACGHAQHADAASERWWAASASDVAVDQAVAAAAGLDAARLPDLRALARQEVFAPAPDVCGELPRLTGHAAGAWRSELAAAAARAGAQRRALVHDATMVRANLHKIPGFVRRRLASRRRAS